MTGRHQIIIVGGGAGGLELATRLGFSQRRLSIAVQMAESLLKEEIALVEALLQFEAAEGDVDRRRTVAESLREVVEQYRDGNVPATAGSEPVDLDLKRAAGDAVVALGGFADLGFNDALLGVWRLFAAANAYVEGTAPWKLAKDPDQANRLDEVLNGLLEVLRVGAILISPVMPESATKLWAQLALPGAPDQAPYTDHAVFGTFPEVTVARGAPLFPRIEAE